MTTHYCVLATTLLFASAAAFPVAHEPHQTQDLQLQKREVNATTSDYEEETRHLVAQFGLLATSLRETLAHILNITANNTLLELPTTTNATVSLLRVALSNMCTTKPLIERLDVADTSVASGCAVDVELSAMLILVKSLYEQSCEWVVAEAQKEGSLLNAQCLCSTPVFSEVATEVCTVWDALLMTEAADQDLTTFFSTSSS